MSIEAVGLFCPSSEALTLDDSSTDYLARAETAPGHYIDSAGTCELLGRC